VIRWDVLHESDSRVFRLITVNVNGLCSAASKGFVRWVARAGADCMSLQEVRLQSADVDSHGFERIGGPRGHFACATKKGHAGVSLHTRREPSDVVCGMGAAEFDV
jgi:exodeoxyribonuclease-3